MIHLGDVPASSTIYIPFATYGKTNGESITCSGLAVTDIEIYKNGSTTQRSSDAGYTLLDTDGIDFDGITGLHGFSIDLSNNTDSGFFAVGSWYWVVVSAITVDSQTVTFLAATFRIGPAEALTGHPKVDVGGWLGTAPATPTTNGVPEVDITHWLGTACATPTVAGVPEVDVTYIGGSAATPTTVPTVAAIADAVWDEDATGHQTQGTFGQAIGDTGASSTSILSRIPDTLTNGNIKAHVQQMQANSMNASALATDAVTEIQSGLATAAQISSLQVNTRANIQVPVEIETPDSGSQTWKIRMFLFDSDGNMEAPDSTPTIALTNAAGTDRSSRLSSATTLSTGAYSWDYTATAGDAEEQLVWVFTVVEGGLTRIYPATSYIVEETAYRFSSSDRATLNATATASALAAVSTKLGTPAGASMSADIAAAKSDTAAILVDTNELQTDWVNGGRLDLILDARASQSSVDTIDDFLDTEIAAIKAKTDNLPIDPADQSAVEAAITAATSALATSTNQTKILDRLGYLMAQEIGACADAGTSAETYTITIDTTTYTVDHTGLTSAGVRGVATLTKT